MTPITAALLRRRPLPLDRSAGKRGRGTVLTVGGAAALPGAAVLSGTAALRAGAGRLQIVVPDDVAAGVAIAVPEALVGSHRQVSRFAADANAIVIGPGLVGARRAAALVRRTAQAMASSAVLVVDAEALSVLATDQQALHQRHGRVVLTPHAAEMAELIGSTERAIERDAEAIARAAARRYRTVVALKGRRTVVASPDGRLFRSAPGPIGLATSGSGDTLSGVIGGLAARGCGPLQAALWGVYLHAAAGRRLARTVGPVGFLARELLAEIPRVMRGLDRKS